MTVNYNIFGQQLRECSDSFIVSGSRNYLELHFNFSGDWDIDGLTRFVQFHKGNTVIEKIIEDDGNVLVPSAVLEDSEDFYVTVFGMTSTDFSDILITTNKIAVNLHEMGMSGANTTDEQVVPLWERVFGKLTELIESLHKICYSGHYDDLEGAPELSPVATSGDYNDLENKPELYTPGDTLDIGNLNIDGSGYNSVELTTGDKNINVSGKDLNFSGRIISLSTIHPGGMGGVGWIDVQKSRITDLGEPSSDSDAVTKVYTDNAVNAAKEYALSLVGNIDSALDGIIAIQNSLIGGENA